MAFAPAGHSTPVRRALKTPALSALITPDISNTSAFEVLSTLEPADVELIDAIVGRTPPTTSQIAALLQAYHDIMRERGHDAAHDVTQYQRLLKLGVVKGSTFWQKWDTVKAKFGYGSVSGPGPATGASRSTLGVFEDGSTTTSPLTATTRTLAPSATTTKYKLSVTQSTSRLNGSSPPYSLADVGLSDTESRATSPPRLSYPRHCAVSPSPENSLGLVGIPRPSTLTAPANLDTAILKAAPSVHPRQRTVSIGKLKVSRRRVSPGALPTIRRAAPSIKHERRPLNPPITRPVAQKSSVLNEEDAWKNIRMAQFEEEADRFYEDRLMERCWGNWRQGLEWIRTTHQQVTQARETVQIHLAFQRWRDFVAQRQIVDSRIVDVANNRLLLRFFVLWKTRIKDRRVAAWREEMRGKMKEVRTMRTNKLMKDAWARWRQLYQSRLAQQLYGQTLRTRYFRQWERRLIRIDDSFVVAEQMETMRAEKAVERCWQNWRRAAELKSAERRLTTRVQMRVLALTLETWRQRMLNQHLAETFLERRIIGRQWERWKRATRRVEDMKTAADQQQLRTDEFRLHTALQNWLAQSRGILLDRVRCVRLLKKSWSLWKQRISDHKAMNERAIVFYARPQGHVLNQALLQWALARRSLGENLTAANLYYEKKLLTQFLLAWRWRLRLNIKDVKHAKLFRQVFSLQNALQIWKAKARNRQLQRRVDVFEKRQLAKVYNAWAQKAARQRYLRSAEDVMRRRVESRTMRDALACWTASVIRLKLRELEMLEYNEMKVLTRAYGHWKAICVRHVEELSLMQSYQDVKQEELLRSNFNRWLSATRTVRYQRQLLSANERTAQRTRLTRVFQVWRDRYQAIRLIPLEDKLAKQMDTHILFRAFAVWQDRTQSLPALRFHALHLRERAWERWRATMPQALLARRARQFDQRAVLTKAMQKWLEVYQTRTDLKAAARARYLRVPAGAARFSGRPAWPERGLAIEPRAFHLARGDEGTTHGGVSKATKTLDALTTHLATSSTRSDTLITSSEKGENSAREQSPASTSRRLQTDSGGPRSADGGRSRLWAELRDAGVAARRPGAGGET